MKRIYILGISMFLIGTFDGLCQKVTQPKLIINTRGINKYHTLKELESMNKGDLIPLYKERVNVLLHILPYIGITTKPGVSFQDLGINSNKENNILLDTEIININLYIIENVKFLDKILPYSDKPNIINGILLYEEFLKNISM